MRNIDKLFVTGSESFIGRHLIDLAGRAGIVCLGCDLKPPSDPRFVQADILDYGSSHQIPEDVDVVVHLAGYSSDQLCRADPTSAYLANVIGSLRMLEAASASNCKQFIFASTEWVYPVFPADRPVKESDPIDSTLHSSDYALSKLMAEQLLTKRASEVEMTVTILRFGIVYGPRGNAWGAVESLASDVVNERPIQVGSLKTSRQFIHVTDIADSILMSAEHGAEGVFNIQGPKSVTLREVISTVSDLSGKTANFSESDPDRPSVRLVSTEKTSLSLGWSAKTQLEDGLKSVLKHPSFSPK